MKSLIIKSLFIGVAIIAFSACGGGLKLVHTNYNTLAASNFSDTIDVEFHNNRIILPVSIEGKTNYFLFDCGAPTIIFESLVKELNYQGEKPTVKLRLLDGKTRTYSMMKINEMAFGKISFKNVWATQDNGTVQKINPCLKIDGIIGSDILSTLAIKLDMRNKQMIITDEDNLFKTEDVFKQKMKISKQGTPHIEVSIQGKKRNVLFDTGSPKMAMLSNLEKYSNIPQEKITSRYDKNGKLYEKEVCLDELMINNISIKDAPIVFPAVKKLSLLGTSILNYSVVILDYKKKEFSLIPYANTQQITYPQGYGFTIELIDSKIKVAKVSKGSLAELAGLKEGFLINKMNDSILKYTSDCDFQNNLNFPSLLLSDSLKLVVIDNDGVEREIVLKR